MTSASDATHTYTERERERGYLNKQSVQEDPRDRGDAGSDDVEVERLKDLTHLDHGVPLLVARDANNQSRITHLTNSKLHHTHPHQRKRGKKLINNIFKKSVSPSHASPLAL